MPAKRIQDHLIGRKIAFIGYALEDPPVLGMVEVEALEIWHDLFEDGTPPEKISVQPQRLMDLEAKGNIGHAPSIRLKDIYILRANTLHYAFAYFMRILYALHRKD
jgi:hypothetical protein